MKRCYLGAGALLLVLVLCFLSSRWMEGRYTSLREQLLLAAQAAQSGDWDRLSSTVDRAEANWQQARKLSAVLADHQYLERAELAFDLLAPAVKHRDRAECTRLCLEIARIFQLLSEEQQLKWENLL